MIKLPKMNLVVKDNAHAASRNPRITLRWSIHDVNMATVMFNGFDDERVALAMLADLETALQYADYQMFVQAMFKYHQMKACKMMPAARMLLEVYDANRGQGIKHKLRSQGAQKTFAAAYGQAVPAATQDPKTKQFINISGELGYEVQDLHEMDDRLKNWIADLVDMSAELDETGDIKDLPDDGSSPRLKLAGTTTGRTSAKGTSSPNVPKRPMAQPYGTPVIPSADKEPEESNHVELDNWDVMAGRHRSARDMHTSKKEWVPDTIDPNVDPLEGIR